MDEADEAHHSAEHPIRNLFLRGRVEKDDGRALSDSGAERAEDRDRKRAREPHEEIRGQVERPREEARIGLASDGMARLDPP